jgi:hypothetical protein
VPLAGPTKAKFAATKATYWHIPGKGELVTGTPPLKQRKNPLILLTLEMVYVEFSL